MASQRPSQQSPSRNNKGTPSRQRPSDLESSPVTFASPTTPAARRLDRSYSSNPATPYSDWEMSTPPLKPVISNHDLNRKKSLVRPERRRVKPNDPNYHYRKHAQGMHVQPSSTGNDPILDESVEITAVESDDGAEPNPLQPRKGRSRRQGYTDTASEKHDQVPLKSHRDLSGKLQRRTTAKEMRKMEEDRLRQLDRNSVRPPSLWNIYCGVISFWAPDAVLRCFGMPSKAQQRAWREKIGLISIILAICTFVGYLTFGFTQTVCPVGATNRLRINHVDAGFLIIHGKAYDLSRSRHPLSRGVPEGANVLFDLGYGGKDASFMFQNVNGACKGLITKTANSDVVSNSKGDLSWYFPCTAVNQDGSSERNITVPYYSGYACHTSRDARDAYYGLRAYGDVYFTWDDVRNKSRNLMVYGSDVVDLNRLEWFNTSEVNYPSQFDAIRQNKDLKGVDVTRFFSSNSQKQTAQCLSQIAKVGSVDTATIGCIASKVVLYVSLVFILSIVVVKFVLALAFQWFLCRKYGASKTSQGDQNSKARQQQIEEWSDDIYRAPPKVQDANNVPAASNRRTSRLFPTTSRFTSPYAIDRAFGKDRPAPTTMASQSSTARLIPSGAYRNASQTTLPVGMDGGNRTSAMMSGYGDRYSSVLDSEGPGPAGFVHENVNPQPPADYEPFGYPLAHAICLVTAYSEGAEGIRTTLDSIATTDYPKSHKVLLVICDGLIKGKGESMTTPDICLSMMRDHAVAPQDVTAFSYVAVSSGSKRHNMAKVYSGFYDYGNNSRIPAEKQQRVPMILIVKCGTPDEQTNAKPGNRGKRDSQVILMSFLQKVMFDERMTELEFEMFNGIWKITGISPDFYEVVLMVDADTKIFPDSVTHMVSAMVKDPEIMGLCGETKIANKRSSWVTTIQVFEYFISHHLSKSFESVFGGVTCLPGCFCMYRIKAPKGGQNYWVPILANPDVVEHYSENVVDTLHKKNLLLLGEDRYLSTLMLKTFPKRKQVFVPQAVCKTTVPEQFSVLLSQRRRWINSTVHNLMELVLVRDLCGTFCFSMQFVVFIELVGTLVLPAAISFTIYLIVLAIKAAATNTEAPVIPLILLAMILGLPAVLIVLTAHRWSYVAWMFVYLISLPIWNFVLPTYAYWKFDDFSWGETRKTAGEKTKKAGIEYEGEFDSSKITMKRWGDFEQERRMKGGWSQQSTSVGAGPYSNSGISAPGSQHYLHQQQQQFDPYYDI